MEPFTRKRFLKRSIVLASALFLLGGEWNLFAKGINEEKISDPPDGLKPVSENDPTAQALGFHQDAKNTDFNLYPERKLPQAKNQVCLQCAQFTKLNEGWGKCSILTNGVVATKGWCSAFSKKM
ncbi:high-potential iron-sulfur protein [Leptospira levettii]|uniref:high-potential iron-sulfur protein n=1 Tax=Leptospira levettii TaxID=2023178 RepID=UPI0010838BE3|nr:high-potential iron-sulfur protein [Leptospira levettii]TGL09994.1 high-potential iron-sulfur protein [Leptospira levettii]